ncbi:hypothetical protein AB0I77_17960 [Streptomyces sp. NPDC050619]|uniref:YciI family protein n=1 Tax=Streptomyces sp. NPDC050619 TaxID=3157214 RepID=UPI003431693D
MYVVELAFTCTPERPAARPAHRATLARLHAEGKRVAAGPWADDNGALLVFALDRTQLEQVMSRNAQLVK